MRKTGRGSWLARCPAHADRSPSLHVTEADDGRILIKCFAECGIHEICGAVGVELHELFPERPIERATRRRIPAHDVLAGLADELMVIEIITLDIEHGVQVRQVDFDRLHVAVQRVIAAKEMALGGR